jgi:hypothetical protein
MWRSWFDISLKLFVAHQMNLMPSHYAKVIIQLAYINILTLFGVKLQTQCSAVYHLVIAIFLLQLQQRTSYMLLHRKKTGS